MPRRRSTALRLHRPPPSYALESAAERRDRGGARETPRAPASAGRRRRASSRWPRSSTSRCATVRRRKSSWAQARAAADVYGSSRGPSLSDDHRGRRRVTRQLTAPTPGRAAGRARAVRSVAQSRVHGARLRWSLRARSTSRDRRRSPPISRTTRRSRTRFSRSRRRRSAICRRARSATRPRSTLDEATAALDAANERHRVGLATIADVLQARTARSQAELDARRRSTARCSSRAARSPSRWVCRRTRRSRFPRSRRPTRCTSSPSRSTR